MRSVFAAIFGMGLCACGPDPAGVHVTLKFSAALVDTQLESITSLVIHATGDEQADYPIGLDRKVSRTERLLYDPDTSSVQLSLSVDAFDDNATRVAGSAVSPVTVKRGASVTLLLEPPGSLPDLGEADLAGAQDLAGADLAGADLAGRDLAGRDLGPADLSTAGHDMARLQMKPDGGAVIADGGAN